MPDRGPDRPRRERRRPPRSAGAGANRTADGFRRAIGLLIAVTLLVAGTACRRPFPVRSTTQTWSAGPAPSWQLQLTGPLDGTVDATVFALDGFRTPAEDTRRLRARDRRLLCYVEVGTYRKSRPDAARYPAGVLGRAVTGAGPLVDGRWVDIRQWSALEPVLADRFRLCRGKGFSAVMPGGMDSYAHRSGFPLTFDDQLTFNRRLATLARRIGLSPGLTNDLDQVLALEPYFDFAVNEECFRRKECERLLPFVDAGKPVFHVEYQAAVTVFCTTTLGYGFASIRKDRALGPRRESCPR